VAEEEGSGPLCDFPCTARAGTRGMERRGAVDRRLLSIVPHRVHVFPISPVREKRSKSRVNPCKKKERERGRE